MNDTTAAARAMNRGSAKASADKSADERVTSAPPPDVAPATQELPVSGKPRFYRFIIPIAAFVVIAAVLGVGIKKSPTVGVIQSPLVGRPAPAWNLPVLNQPGRTIGSHDFAGKWYVLNFWGAWCFACKDEHEELLRISRSSSVPIIGIDWGNDDDTQATAYLNDLGNPYEIVATDRVGRVVVDWGVYGAPESFLVNPEGVVVYKKIGPITPEEWNENFASRLPEGLGDHKS